MLLGTTWIATKSVIKKTDLVELPGMDASLQFVAGFSKYFFWKVICNDHSSLFLTDWRHLSCLAYTRQESIEWFLSSTGDRHSLPPRKAGSGHPWTSSATMKLAVCQGQEIRGMKTGTPEHLFGCKSELQEADSFTCCFSTDRHFVPTFVARDFVHQADQKLRARRSHGAVSLLKQLFFHWGHEMFSLQPWV